MSHDINWFGSTTPLFIGSSTPAAASDWADGQASGPAADLFQADLRRVEGFLEAGVGNHTLPPAQATDSDGFAGDGCLRGYNFRSNGLTDVFTLRRDDTFAICTEPNLVVGSGSDPSPLPGGSLRFYIWRQPVAIWTFFSTNVIGYGTDSVSIPDWYLRSKFDDDSQSTTLIRVRGAGWGPGTVVQASTSWALTEQKLATDANPGWHYVSHEAEETGRGIQLVTKGTELIVIVAYR